MRYIRILQSSDMDDSQREEETHACLKGIVVVCRERKQDVYG
jgi:hypothetical protein